jgi:hypothetical protein
MSGLDNSQKITDEVSLHAEEAGLAGQQPREHVAPPGAAPAGHLPGGPGEVEEEAGSGPAS